MDQVNKRSNVLDFVGLKVSDKVPLNVLRKNFGFIDQLLYFVFSERTLSCVVRFL